MRHISTTPFGRRAVTAAHLQRQELAEAPAPCETPDKWLVLRELTEARKAFGISDRDLAVLAALLSFHPAKLLTDDDALIVFPSNRSLSGRVHGMPESTLRRHLAALVGAGLILRHDSPNGKRYATRASTGHARIAFGFDLRPLLIRWSEVSKAAEDAREARIQSQAIRQKITVQLRDVAKLMTHAADSTVSGTMGLAERLADLHRQLRRKLELPELEELAVRVNALLTAIGQFLPSRAKKTSGDDTQNERHIQNSEPYLQESERCTEDEAAKISGRPKDDLPLKIVLKAVPELTQFSPTPIRTWRDFLNAASFVRPMLGIDTQSWDTTRQKMGEPAAAIAIAFILERVSTIRRPGAYLRVLGDKSISGEVSPAAMIRALLQSNKAQPQS
ncbi:plasmid replication protein RepC [Paracoccus sp. MBLB3053]|uniref:Plasmid replication protein RepC n=1 Tax=Paracoccus aurantius TaxID=3073814 RepID=A0ABU2HZ88_9RHOB|nr:plasmid replication protein RepC [Paracoccus sp. MBLB3053]MDS9469865.1 plasmid replication protein RepC [Paracoccus sp. MBLB3053]